MLRRVLLIVASLAVSIVPSFSQANVRAIAHGIEPDSMLGSAPATGALWPEPQFTYAYLRAAWADVGRKWLQDNSGLQWNAATKSWVAQPNWKQGDVAQTAYALEHALRTAVAMGMDCQDKAMLDEVAAFYNAYQVRFITLGQLRSLGKGNPNAVAALQGQGRDTARTLKWVMHAPGGDLARECVLCESQFLHPAARLIRIIAALPQSQRTATMKTFVATYTPLIVRDHLIRQLYEADHPDWGARGLPSKLVPLWKAFLPGGAGAAQHKYVYAEDDQNLWIIAAAAEILGANANDPKLVPLTTDEKQKLQDAVRTQIALFQSKRTLYSDTRNWQGKTVSSASYFNGENVTDPDMAYSGYYGEKFPTPADKKVNPQASWDISHAYRIPVFLRSLYDNRNATGSPFPSLADMQLVANQFTYRSFQGNLSAPLFNNYLDGSNGWFRVGYHGSNFGYAPAQYCNDADGSRQCLEISVAMGWGLLDSFSPDMDKLEHALAQLTLRTDNASRTFRDEHYGKSSAFLDASGKPEPSSFDLWLLGEVPERLQGCTASHP